MIAASHQTGHRARLKARLKKDAAQLADYELLELLLGCVVLRRDTKALAKTLLQRFDTLRGVLDARPNELMSLEGFGPALCQFWQLLRELMARYEEAPVRRREVLCTPDSVARMARVRLAACPHEELWIALTDHGNRLMAWERLRQGTVGQVPILPRDVLEMALNGVPNVDIVTGDSEFFQLRPGSNQITLMDGETSRKLTVTVIWENRWL